MNTVEPGLYRHFKGGTVYVFDVVNHSETLEPLVIYVALYECKTGGVGSMWARPMSMFLENVEHEGKTVPRFERIRDGMSRSNRSV